MCIEMIMENRVAKGLSRFLKLGVFSVIVVQFLTGCGITFRDRNINMALSPAMLGTSVFTDTEIVKRHLEDVPGYIVQDDGRGNLKPLAPLSTAGYVPTVTTINDDQAFYHSV